MSHSAPPLAGPFSPLCSIFSGFSSSQQSASPPRVFAPPHPRFAVSCLLSCPLMFPPPHLLLVLPEHPGGHPPSCGSLIGADAFTCSRISPRRARLRHGRKQKSQAQTERGKFNKAVFSTYICERCRTASKTSPIHNRADPRGDQRIQVPGGTNR